MAQTGYINPEVAKMYGIPYHKLTAKQKKILHADSVRRAKLIKERQEAVMRNNLKAFTDEAQMERVLGQIYNSCQKKILADVTETIAKVQKAGGTWSYANMSALTRSRGLFEQIEEEIKKLGQKEESVFYTGLSNIYTDQFQREVYTLGQTMTVKANFNRLNPAYVRQTLDYPWSGAMFSDRIWNDKGTLGRNLRIGLTQSMILGEGVPQITERINKNINTSRYNAERLARTETKRVCYVAHDDVMEDCGVSEVRYMCANSALGMDKRVCKVCRAFDGMVFKRGEEPTLPIHPNCRCWYVPEVSDTFEDNELNELTHSVRGAENYEKWQKAQAEKEAEEDIVLPTPKVVKAQKVGAKTDNDNMSRVDQMKLTDYPEPFYSKKAEASNTQALMDYVNTHNTGANADTVALYRSMDKAYNLDKIGATFNISHGKNHAVSISNWDDKVTLCIPKLSGDDIAGQVQTTLHEEMHLLDFLLSEKNRAATVSTGIQSGTWCSSANAKLGKLFVDPDYDIGDTAKALFAEHKKQCDEIAKKMAEKMRAEHDKILNQYMPNGAWAAGADYKGYKKAYSKLKSSIEDERDYLTRNLMGGGVGNLEDIYDALSGGTARESGKVRFGHGRKYYRSIEARREETLANYGALSITRPDLIKILAEDKPDLVEALEDTVAEMIKIVGGK